MFHLFFSCLLIFSFSLGFSQKPPLNFSIPWENVADGIISNDGKSFCYARNNDCGKNFLVIQSLDTTWKKEIQNGTDATFLDDHSILFKIKDSLFFFQIGAEKFKFIDKVKSYKICVSASNYWIAYKPADSVNELILENIKSWHKKQFLFISDFEFNQAREMLVLVRDSSNNCAIQGFNISDDSCYTIWTNADAKIKGFSCDKGADQFAFIVQKNKQNRLWYYRDGSSSARLLTDSTFTQSREKLFISDEKPEFTNDGKNILFSLEEYGQETSRNINVSLDVWSYTDSQLQSQQLIEKNWRHSYKVLFDVEKDQLTRLEQSDETIFTNSGNVLLLIHQLGLRGVYEAYWNKCSQPSFSIVSLIDGSRKLIKANISNLQGGVGLSPTGKWVVYYDFDRKSFYSYEVATGEIRSISKHASSDWIDERNDEPEKKLCWVPWRDTWLKNDEGVLIYDNYDVWLIDPKGKNKPIDLTNGYGKKHKIKFELIGEGQTLNKCSSERRSTLIFKAVNLKNKDWGFYKVTLGKSVDPELLNMGPYIYGAWSGHDTYNNLSVKARNAKVWLVLKSSATEAPNYFVTGDFKTFKQLTKVQPQKKYNWYTRELRQWKSLDGMTLQGILYKPDNFDSTKKYPIIFDYYERRSDELNMFIWPKASEGRINIPLFVSNGYLVFVPDIKYKIGCPGRSAYNSIVSAARYLSKFKWVDSKRMGLQGHSFGGFETNYIVTHSNLFAAACSASGPSDQVSKYGSGLRGGFPMYLAEESQSRLGAMPWDRPDYYINNSPIYFADKVSTPLLMMNNKNDGAVPFSQGVEFFAALRRLGKREWMLQYDNGGHEVEGKDAEDFHTRMMQFFDHYLKDSACPRWMLYGVPAADKGDPASLELVREKDPKTGKWLTPKEGGLLTDEEKKKVGVLKHRKPITVTIE